MKTRKNLFALIAFCIIISVLASTTVLARLTYIDITTTTLSISSSGTATAIGNASGYQGTTTQIKINLELQQYKNGSWNSLPNANWSQTFPSHRGNLSQTYSVAKGYKYRVKATYYGNGNLEVVDYSSEVYYQ